MPTNLAKRLRREAEWAEKRRAGAAEFLEAVAEKLRRRVNLLGSEGAWGTVRECEREARNLGVFHELEDAAAKAVAGVADPRLHRLTVNYTRKADSAAKRR